MINYFRMDMRRILRSRWFYITLGVIVLLLLFSFFMIKLALDPELIGQLSKAGITVSTSVDEVSDAKQLMGASMESLIGSMLFSGGMMVSIIVIISSILVCEDFRSGFVKNLFSCRTKRGHYIFGKMLAFFAVNVIYMAVFILVILGLNKLMGFNISLGSPKHLLMMIGAGCLIITALIAQNLLFCMLTRNAIAGSVLSILCGAGVISGAIQAIAGLFNADLSPFLLGEMLRGLPYMEKFSAQSIAAAVLWLAAYTGASAFILNKKDIA